MFLYIVIWIITSASENAIRMLLNLVPDSLFDKMQSKIVRNTFLSNVVNHKDYFRK